MNYNNLTISAIESAWNEATKALFNGDVNAVETRKNIFEYINGRSTHAAELLTTDPAEAFSGMYRHFFVESGSHSTVLLTRPDTIEERAKRWSCNTTYTYKEISEAEADKIEAAEAAEAARKEEAARAEKFNSFQEYNKKMIEFLTDAKPLIKSFSSKVFNKKIDDLVDEAFPIRWGKENTNGKRRLYICRSYYEPAKNRTCVYLEFSFCGDYNRKESVKLEIITAEGKQPRIDAEKTLQNINSKIAEIDTRIQNNDRAKANRAEQIKAAEAVRDAVKAYYETVKGYTDQYNSVYPLPHDLKGYIKG